MKSKVLTLMTVMISVLFLQACVHKLVTIPAKIAYKTTKGVVQGTTYVVEKVIPGGDDDDD